MRGIEADLREQSWTDVEFGMTEGDRAEYARLANEVLSLGLDNEDIRRALTFDILPPADERQIRSGFSGISGARNSDDTKLWLHAGYQSRERADSVMPERLQPLALADFWLIHYEVLHNVERSVKTALEMMGAAAVAGIVYPPDHRKRNIHIRTVRYLGAHDGQPGDELVSGHADLGLVSQHLFETHGGWFHAVPYVREHMTDEITPERTAAIAEMRAKLKPLSNIEEDVIFFLGAGWHGLPENVLPAYLRDLPASYHAGFRPEPAGEIVSHYANKVTGDNGDRVAVIAFMHPDIDFAVNGGYVQPSVEKCRPSLPDEASPTG